MKYTYQVWLLGLNDEYHATDYSKFLKTFSTKKRAAEFANSIEKEDLDIAEIPADTTNVEVTVERVVDYGDYEDTTERLGYAIINIKEEE